MGEKIDSAIVKDLIIWVKQNPFKAAAMINQQKKEYIMLSQSIAEEDAIIDQLQEEVNQYKLKEKLLREQVKKLNQEICELNTARVNKDGFC